MEIKYIKDEFGLAMSTDKVFVPQFKSAIDIWANTALKKPTNKQSTVLNDFFNIDDKEFDALISDLDIYRKSLIAENRIVKTSMPVSDLTELSFRQIIIPQQENTSNKFLFVYADTNWKIRYSKFIIELEILFTNNKFDLVQESTGLWARLEWKEYYNK